MVTTDDGSDTSAHDAGNVLSALLRRLSIGDLCLFLPGDLPVGDRPVPASGELAVLAAVKPVAAGESVMSSASKSSEGTWCRTVTVLASASHAFHIASHWSKLTEDELPSVGGLLG